MKKDIKNRADIELLVNTFYHKVEKDKTIGYIFTDVAKVNWDKHLPVMYDFWENILFFTGNYSGNPTDMHRHLGKVSSLNNKHFKRWNMLFKATVNELFAGEKADLAIQKAVSIAKELKANVLH